MDEQSKAQGMPAGELSRSRVADLLTTFTGRAALSAEMSVWSGNAVIAILAAAAKLHTETTLIASERRAQFLQLAEDYLKLMT